MRGVGFVGGHAGGSELHQGVSGTILLAGWCACVTGLLNGLCGTRHTNMAGTRVRDARTTRAGRIVRASFARKS
eukprot:4390624-Prymnesium_polylepis.1